MKYLKKFNNESEYNSFTDSESFILPNVSLVVDVDVVHYSKAGVSQTMFIVGNNYSNEFEFLKTQIGIEDEKLSQLTSYTSNPSFRLVDGEWRWLTYDNQEIICNNTALIDFLNSLTIGESSDNQSKVIGFSWTSWNIYFSDEAGNTMWGFYMDGDGTFGFAID